ncbi:GNAT family N-acetyltransferase [Thermodesulfobacteriota bacterium]
MRIRIAQEEDLPQIVGIYNQAVAVRGATADLEPVSLEDRAEWFRVHDEDTYPIFVALSGERVIGWCALSPYRPGRAALRHTAEISYYIDEDHRRQGIGSALIHHAIAQCGKLEIRNLFALLLDINAASVHILEKLDFEKWGHMPGIADIDDVECGHLIYGKRVLP